MIIARAYPSAAALDEYHAAPRKGHRYGRDSSPEVAEAEQAIEAYHPGYEAVLFSSGMAAIAAVLDVFGSVVLPDECYRKMLPLAGDRARPDGAVVWAESPSNPHLRLADYEKLEQESRPVAIDLTLAGLGNFKGDCDIIVHSLTKYACGHNDFLAGVVLAKEETANLIWQRRSMAGGIPDPITAWLLMRSLKTYDLRMERHIENTLQVLAWLRRHVEHVFYPPESRWHVHGGAVVSFRVPGGDPVELTDRIGSARTIRMAPSFGAVDTMAEVPATMSRAPGVEPDLIRLSVGIEPVGRIIEDLERIIG